MSDFTISLEAFLLSIIVPVIVLLALKIWYNSLEEIDIDEAIYLLANGELPKLKRRKKRMKIFDFLKKLFKRKNVKVYARVYRVDKGVWEDLGKIAEGKVNFKVKRGKGDK